MKKTIIAASIVSFLAVSCTSSDTKTGETGATINSSDTASTAVTDGSSAENTAAPLDSATIQKNWISYMTPGKEHALMASWNGDWLGTVTMWHAPGAPPETSKSTASNKMVMGGRYQVGTHTGSMMGQPFEGMSTLAFDNAKKVFVSTWVDNVGTGVMKLEGPWDEASKTMSLSGKCVDPTRGDGSEMVIRETLKMIDDKNQLLEMYGPDPDGKEFKMMEIKYTRQ